MLSIYRYSPSLVFNAYTLGAKSRETETKARLCYISAEIDSIDRPNDPRYVRRSCHEEARRIQSIKQGCEVIELVKYIIIQITKSQLWSRLH